MSHLKRVSNHWISAAAGILLLCASGSGAAAEPVRVLLINPFSRNVDPFSSAAAAFRSNLIKELKVPVDFHEVPLDLARSASADETGPLIEFLEARIRAYPVDLVVPIGGLATQFVHQHRARLFPETPVLVVAAEVRTIPPGLLEENATAVSQNLPLDGVVEEILALSPETSQIAVVFGSSPLERFWVGECRREFAKFSDRVEFLWLDGLPLEETVKRCSELPPDSFIFHGLFLVDGVGVPVEENGALKRLRESANAPVYGLFDSEFGLGIIGGRLFPSNELGREGALIASRILSGEPITGIAPKVVEMSQPRFDSRELQKWRIDESRLPEGAMVEFREPPLWRLYLWPVLGGGFFLILQTFLIAALLVNRARWKREEAEASLIADISSKFVNLPPDEMDHEILEAQRRLCEFLDLDLIAIWQWENRADGCYRSTHVYSREFGPQPTTTMSDDQYPWCREQMLAGRIVSFQHLDDLPAEAAADKEMCRVNGMKSNLTIPLTVGGGVPVGVIALNTLRKEREWPDTLVKRMQLIAQIFTNAIARKQAEAGLRESEMRLSLAIESADAGLWELDLQNQTFHANNKAREIFAYTATEEINMDRFQERVHPEDWPAVRESVRRSVEEGCPIDLQYRILPRKGEERWVISRGRPITLRPGKPERIIGLSMDVTEQRRAEDRLHQLSLVVEQSPVLVVITDLKGHILYVNERFTEVTGYTLEECRGRSPRILKSGVTPPEIYEDLWRTICGGQVWRGEFQNRKKNGEFYWERAIISPLLDEEGHVTHYVGVKEDITDRRRIEAEASDLRANLAHASRVTILGQLASGLAHELSQPLGAILRNAEAAEIMLRDDSPDLDEIRAIIGDILRDDQRAGQVIDHLRSLLKRRQIDPRPLEVTVVIEEVLALIDSDAAARQVRIETLADGNLPEILGDRIHVQQVLLNLLVNAMDAVAECPRDLRAIEVFAGLSASFPGFVEVRVSDNGPGIDPGLLDRLFEPFFTSKASGMGVGLPVSKTLVEAHRGKIWAENGSEGGACFRFTLPVAEGDGRSGNPE